MFAGAYVGGCGMELAGGRERNGGREARLFVVKWIAVGGLLLLLSRLPDPSCVLGRDEGELTVVSDDVGQIGGYSDLVVLPVGPSGTRGLWWLRGGH